MNDENAILPAEPVERPAEMAPATLFNTSDPELAMDRAAKVAGVLAKAIRAQKLTSNIQGKEYVKVEGWTLLGSLLGVFPVPVEKVDLPNGYEVRVEARTRDGQTIGAAWARCTRAEKTWASRDDYALLSMAQTRATSKALRLPLGFVMQLAGYDPLPADEVPEGGFHGGAVTSASAPSGDERPHGGARGQGRPTESPARAQARGKDPVGKWACPTCAGQTVFANKESGKMFCSTRYGGCGAEWKTREAWDAAHPPVAPKDDDDDPGFLSDL